jgi:hypothetical protein
MLAGGLTCCDLPATIPSRRLWMRHPVGSLGTAATATHSCATSGRAGAITSNRLIFGPWPQENAGRSQWFAVFATARRCAAKIECRVNDLSLSRDIHILVSTHRCCWVIDSG